MSYPPKRILFLDVTAPKPYDSNTLATEPQGGTESTVTRIAEGLAARGHSVTVMQKARQAVHWRSGGPAYVPYKIAKANFDAVVALRSPDLVPAMRLSWPNAHHILWLHDYNQVELVQKYDLIRGPLTVVCVSRTHKTAVADALLRQVKSVEGTRVSFIYNPIADDLRPDSTPVDPKKLVFFSSPHKGLDHALTLFRRLRHVDDSYTLHVANPGYYPSATLEGPGVVALGELPHPAVLQHVRSSLAVFHPNTVFPETFGLVHAEANALGVPVLTSILGANREVLNDARQTVNVFDEKTVIDTLQAWSAGKRPVVQGCDEFRLSKVLDQWEVLIGR